MQLYRIQCISSLTIIASFHANLALCGQASPSEQTFTELSTSTTCPAQDQIKCLCAQHFSKCNDALGSESSKCSESCLIPTDEVESTPLDPDYLPSRFYDALDNPISEDEYWRQVEYEEKHGVPFIRDRAAEQANLDKPISLLTYSSLSCQDEPNKRITERSTCYGSPMSLTIFIESLPSNCEVVTFLDSTCKEDPLTALPMFGMKHGCLWTDSFGSVRVDCHPLPE